MSQQINPQTLLKELLQSTDSLAYHDNGLDGLIRRSEMVIRNVFGADSKYLTDLKSIDFYPMVYPASDESYRSSWTRGTRNFQNLIRTMQEELMLFGGTAVTRESPATPNAKDVFIVHGHDEAIKVNVARTLEKLGLVPIILHEKPNQGRTVIEKFTDYSAVGFAVVLLSPDDVGKLRTAPVEDLRPRARQNVIFELGFFLGRLGRERVLALYAPTDNFELPSDYSGVLFVPFDSSGRWQFDLVRELKAADYDVDANALLNR
jgi:hypothetical protein